jgi:hypothetical protein
MPHAALRLLGGVNSNETPAQNQNGGLTDSNLVRAFYDPNGLSLIQKLGGWTAYFPTPMVAIVRALWAWQDLNIQSHLAVGTETISGTSSAQLSVITNGTLDDITPTSETANVAPVFQTQAGNFSVLVTDPSTPGVTNYDTVYIATEISIGGLILFGLYQASPDTIISPNSFTIFARDQLGNLQNATTTDSMPVLPSFTTVGPTGSISGSTTVTVTLPNYTYAVGATFPVLTPTMVGGITFFGNYVVQSQIDANNFTIISNTPASSTDTGTLNGGLAQFIYSFGVGAIPGGTGYGIGTYGSGGYGTGTAIVPALGTPINAIDWTLDNWGEILIACAVQPPGSGTPFQPIYMWDPGQPTATIIAAAPPVNDGIFVAMPQRQIVAWGSTETGIQDPLLISWCDVNNFNSWIPTVTNQAGNYRIPKGSRIQGCVQGPQQAIVLTDIDAWSMQYVGPPFVYSFNEVGTGCGAISRKSIAADNGIYYWMGPSQFFTLSGAGVQVLECPVWDVVFQNIDPDNTQKIRVAVNSRFSEIEWFYPSLTGNGEVDSYVKYHTSLGVWDIGTIGRTAWVDQSVLGPPIGADPLTDLLFQHETSNDADGQAMAPFFQTGYFSISEGDFQSFIDLVWPDMKWTTRDNFGTGTSAQVMISFLVTDYPGDTPVIYGPYTVTRATQYFNTRLRGRLVAVKISSDDLGSFWRIGQLRYRFSQDGKF